MEDKIKKHKFKVSPEQLLKRYWPHLAVAALIVAAVSYGLFQYAISDGASATVEPNSTSTTATEFDDGLTDRLLDGYRVPQDQSALIPRAVMIENHVDARPLSGIAKANLVFEAPVEGGITRMLVVFDASTTVDQIGPIRSARPYFLELAQSINAMYVHVGGSPEALNRIGGLIGFRNLDEMAGENYFWRNAKRYAPHNAYTSTDNLNRAEQDKEWTAKQFTPWIFADTDTEEVGNATTVTIPYSGSYKVKWIFDPESGLYQRYLGGVLQKDSDGSQVTTKNIIVLQSEQKTLDDYGRLQVRTTGEGKAWIFQNGFAQVGKWSRSAGKFFVLQTADGNNISLSRGTSWVEFATLAKYEPSYQEE